MANSSATPPGQAPDGTELSLTVVAGRGFGQTIVVSDEPVVLGRAQAGTMSLGGDPELSREHARVSRFEGGGILLEDLRSTNGTFVNGALVAGPTVLHDGDVVWMGTTTLLVREPDERLPEITPVEPPAPSSQAGSSAASATWPTVSQKSFSRC